MTDETLEGSDPFTAPVIGSLQVLDWRRRVGALYSDVRANADPAQAHALWTAGRDMLLSAHPASPVRRERAHEFEGARYGAYDPAMRFEVELELVAEPAEDDRWEFATATDGVVPFTRVGVLRLPDLGTLDVWWLESYGGGIFVPLKDRSAAHTTYGGGRYLIDTVKGADLGGDLLGSRRRPGSRLVVDLNFAYNPSCAYDPAWACPLPPAGNRLDVELAVGELYP